MSVHKQLGISRKEITKGDEEAVMKMRILEKSKMKEDDLLAIKDLLLL